MPPRIWSINLALLFLLQLLRSSETAPTPSNPLTPLHSTNNNPSLNYLIPLKTTTTTLRQVQDFPFLEVGGGAEYLQLADNLEGYCPNSIQFPRPTQWIQGGILSYPDIIHDGKQCSIKESSPSPEHHIEFIPGNLFNEDDSEFPDFAQLLVQSPVLQKWKKVLEDGKARYYVGRDRRDRECPEVVFPRNALSFWVRVDKEMEFLGGLKLERGKQYLIMTEPDNYNGRKEEEPTCVYSIDAPVGKDSNKEGVGNEEVEVEEEEEGEEVGSGGNNSTAGSNEDDGEGGSSMSTGAIAGIAVGATFGAIAIAAAAFVTYRVYHGKTVPIIPEQLLPGPPSR